MESEILHCRSNVISIWCYYSHRSVLNILDPLLASQTAANGVVTIICRIEILTSAQQ